MSRSGSLILALVLAILVALNGSGRVRHTGNDHQLTLWAWERPERLTFLRSKDTAVAYLAGTIDLSAEPVLKPRFQPLQVNEGTPLIAVVRLEVTPKTPTVFTDEYRATVVRQIFHSADLPRVDGLQIDFDATRSQRSFYRALLLDIRGSWPADKSLSITALGSWCLGDDWIGDLPIDEAVPMLFRMGVDRGNIVNALQGGHDFREPLCRTSIGVSMDEPWPEPLLSRHVYVFNPRAWDAATFAQVQRKLPQ